jgi:hypothetical protein
MNALRPLGWLASLAGCSLALLVVPVGDPPAPGTLDLAGLARWAPDADSWAVILAAVRAAAFALAAYLFVASVVLVGARARPLRLARVATLLVPRSARRALYRALGVTVLTVQLQGPLAGAAWAHESGAESTATATLELAEHSPTATLELIAPAPELAGPDVVEPVSRQPDVSADARDSWLVEPGDHFWSIAERTRHLAPDRTLTEHWEHLIELNRDRLPDPANADLIIPGMQLRLR